MAEKKEPGGELGICLGIIFIIGGILMMTGAQDGGGITMSVTGYHSAGEIGAEGLIAIFIGIVGLICGGFEMVGTRRRYSKSDVNDLARSSDEYERGYAISKIDDQSKLAHIAKNDSSYGNRKKAIKKIRDERTLADIVISFSKYSHDYSMMEYAIKNIDDQDLLIEIARRSRNGSARSLAGKKIKDETVLAELAKNEEYYASARSFYNNIKDEHLLAGIAKTTTNSSVLGDILLKKVKSEAVLADIAKNTSAYHMYGAKKVFKKVHDPSLLADIAKNATDYRFRMDAIKRVRDESVLIDIVKNDSYRLKKDSSIRDAGAIKEKVTIYEYPVREKANKKLGGGYESYCREEEVSSVVH